jgi:hypothetical protein
MPQLSAVAAAIGRHVITPGAPAAAPIGVGEPVAMA